MVMTIFTGIIFVFIYLDLQFNVQKLVLKCLDLPNMLMKKAFSAMTLSKRLL